MQLQADLHTHTIASTHGYSTITEMAQGAADAGISLLATTDHGVGSPDAPHLWHFHNYKILPRKLCGVWLLKGVEANICGADGTLDMDEKELAFCEWVVASMHTPCVQYERTPENVTKAYLGALDNPLIDVLGHPTEDVFPYDYEPVLKKCKEAGVFVEMNESSLRWKKGALKNAQTVYAICKKWEIPIVVDSDAHFHQLVGKAPLSQQLLADLEFPTSLIANLDSAYIMECATKKRGIQFTDNADASERSSRT